MKALGSLDQQHPGNPTDLLGAFFDERTYLFELLGFIREALLEPEVRCVIMAMPES